MQILFVHPNFPAQFAGTLRRLGERPDVERIFVSHAAEGQHSGVRCLRYELRGGATRATHYCSRSFENATWHAHAVYETCRAAKLRPDLIVGHSGFGTTAFLRELYDAPIANYFEYFYHPHGTDMDFRPEFPPAEIDFLRARARNAMILLDLHACSAGYTPTAWQRSLFPEPWGSRLEVIPDGVDTEFWRRRSGPRLIAGEGIPDDVRVVTYVARGLEAMRGFDVFVRVAKRMLRERQRLLFAVVGEARTFYGNDEHHFDAPSFRDHVMRQEQVDPRHFRFLGRIPPSQLAALWSLSDLHVYLTVPFVLSWSLVDAMACACPIVGSDTPPVREVIDDGVEGRLAPFHDVEALACAGLELLADPERARAFGDAARRKVEASYSLDISFPLTLRFFDRLINRV